MTPPRLIRLPEKVGTAPVRGHAFSKFSPPTTDAGCLRELSNAPAASGQLKDCPRATAGGVYSPNFGRTPVKLCQCNEMRGSRRLPKFERTAVKLRQRNKMRGSHRLPQLQADSSLAMPVRRASKQSSRPSNPVSRGMIHASEWATKELRSLELKTVILVHFEKQRHVRSRLGHHTIHRTPSSVRAVSGELSGLL